MLESQEPPCSRVEEDRCPNVLRPKRRKENGKEEKGRERNRRGDSPF
jgi:hypothetical protein